MTAVVMMRKAPRIFFQVKIRRMRLLAFLPSLPLLLSLAPRPPFLAAALRAAARPPGGGGAVSVAVSVAVDAEAVSGASVRSVGSPREERFLGAARRPPLCRARLSSARPMSPLAPLPTRQSHQCPVQVSSEN